MRLPTGQTGAANLSLLAALPHPTQPMQPTHPTQPSSRPGAGKASKKKGAIDDDEEYTTVMLRNIPNKYTRTMLIDQLHRSGFLGQIDYMYLPTDFANRCNVGYCFCNFRTSRARQLFCKLFDAQPAQNVLPGFNSYKVCQVTKAKWQGRSENVRRLRSSPELMAQLMQNPDWLPMLLTERGEQEEFPIEEDGTSVPYRTVPSARAKKKQQSQPQAQLQQSQQQMYHQAAMMPNAFSPGFPNFSAAAAAASSAAAAAWAATLQQVAGRQGPAYPLASPYPGMVMAMGCGGSPLQGKGRGAATGNAAAAAAGSDQRRRGRGQAQRAPVQVGLASFVDPPGAGARAMASGHDGFPMGPGMSEHGYQYMPYEVYDPSAYYSMQGYPGFVMGSDMAAAGAFGGQLGHGDYASWWAPEVAGVPTGGYPQVEAEAEEADEDEDDEDDEASDDPGGQALPS